MSDCLAIATRSAQLLINLGGILPIPGMRNVGSLAYSVFTAIQACDDSKRPLTTLSSATHPANAKQSR